MWIKKAGFTFIEVIIAIAVFSIGVLAVLNLIMHNLNTLDKTQSKITATLLAKEGIEIAYNMRDSNLQKWFARDCVLKTHDELKDINNPTSLATDDVCTAHFSSWFEWKALQFSFDPQHYYWSKVVDISSGFALFEENRLSYFTGTLTSFARYLVFTWLQDQGNLLPKDKIVKIESHVIYRRWWYEWEVVLESTMWNF